jgi:hypothetical protein
VTTSRAAEFIIKLPPSETPLAIGFCSCLKYQDYQAPCSHAIACIQYLSLNPFDYFYPYYRWDVSLRNYSLPITPVSIQGLLIVEDNSLPLLPPIKKPKRGRPKISRIRSSHLSEEKKTYLCSICQQPGHNRRICPNQPVEHGRAQRARDQLVEDSEDSTSFSDWSSCSDTTSDIIEVDQGDQFDLFWAEQEQWIYDHGVQSIQDQGNQLNQAQEVQVVQDQVDQVDQVAQERRYPSRKRRRTVKATALAREY